MEDQKPAVTTPIDVEQTLRPFDVVPFDVTRVRAIVGVHLIAVASSCLCSLADRGLLPGPAFLRFVLELASLCACPGMLCWVACPLALIVLRLCGLVQGPPFVLGMIAEALLCIAQLWMLLPLVSEFTALLPAVCPLPAGTTIS